MGVQSKQSLVPPASRDSKTALLAVHLLSLLSLQHMIAHISLDPEDVCIHVQSVDMKLLFC